MNGANDRAGASAGLLTERLADRPAGRLERSPRRRFVISSVLAALVLLASLVGYGVARVTAPAPRAGAAAALPAEPAITGQFSRFALNALLVPLLDDRNPPHWTDVGLRFFCGPATRVDVDGHPLVPGAAVPTSAFTVRWHIDRCWPLDYAAFELSGVVEMQVVHENGGLRAVVHAQHLRIATARGSGQLPAPFTAWLALGGQGSLAEQ